MRVLRNLDLAIDIINDEGKIILKKYDDVNEYLKRIAGDKIYKFKARQQMKKLMKRYPDLRQDKDESKIKFAEVHGKKDRKKGD